MESDRSRADRPEYRTGSIDEVHTLSALESERNALAFRTMCMRVCVLARGQCEADRTGLTCVEWVRLILIVFFQQPLHLIAFMVDWMKGNLAEAREKSDHTRCFN